MSTQEKIKRAKEIIKIIEDFPDEVQVVVQAQIEGLQQGLRINAEKQAKKESA